MVKLVIELDDHYNGDPSFFQGHGHVFEKENCVACLAVGFSIDYRETVSDIIERIKEELPATDYEPVNEELFKKYEDEIRNLSDEDFIRAFKDALEPNTKLEDKFFRDDFEIDEDIDDEIYDPPMLLLYFHIYVEEE